MNLEQKMQTIMGDDASPGMFRIGEYVYATNGRICGRCVGIEAVEPPKQMQTQTAQDRIAGLWSGIENAEWQPFEFEPVDCDRCLGKCYYVGECVECFHGEHECYCGHTHDCGFCEGTGKQTVPCRHSRYLLGCKFDDKYLVRMKTVGVDSIALAERYMLWFRFDGGVGVLMGLEDQA